jgi:rhamnose utilization protein RhaD (predicted bifunctional aldolase and dehydrogenase)
MKKSFIEEAENRISRSAEAFISDLTKKETNKKQTTNIPEIENQIKETKSKALRLLVKPSIYEALKKEAKEKELSVNETANRIFDIYIKSRQNNR